MQFKIQTQMIDPTHPTFLVLPNDLQHICKFPKQLSYQSVLEYTHYWFTISNVNSRREDGGFKNLTFKFFQVWCLEKDPTRVVLLQGKNPDNFYVLAFFNESVSRQEYIDYLTSLEWSFAKVRNIKEYK